MPQAPHDSPPQGSNGTQASPPRSHTPAPSHGSSLLTAKQMIEGDLAARRLSVEEARLEGRVIIAFKPLIQQMWRNQLPACRHPYLGKLGRLANGWVVCGHMGSACAAIQAEKLVALGASELLYFGVAGALAGPTPNCQWPAVSDVVVSSGALNETGTALSYGYPWHERVPADERLCADLLRWLTNHGLAARESTHWCTDAPFCETAGKARAFFEMGARCVEMEAAGLFAACKARDVAATAAFVISDELREDGWHIGWHDARFTKQLARVAELLVGTGEQI